MSTVNTFLLLLGLTACLVYCQDIFNDEDDDDDGDDDGDDDDYDTKRLPTGAVIAICCIPIPVLVVLVCLICYQQHQYAQRKKRLEELGFTTGDFKLAYQATMSQVRRRLLTTNDMRTAGPRDLANAAKRWFGSPDGSDPVMSRFHRYMEYFAAQRRGDEAGAMQLTSMAPANHGRVRHPAGDIQSHNHPSDHYPLTAASQMDNWQADPYTSSLGRHSRGNNSQPHSFPDIVGGDGDNEGVANSNNNVLVNNNTAANLNYTGQNGSRYYASPYHQQPGENLHQEANGLHQLSVADNHDSASSRSLERGSHSGRNSPRETATTHSSSSAAGDGGHNHHRHHQHHHHRHKSHSPGRRSPRPNHHNQQQLHQNEDRSSTLTYYGMIGNGESSQPQPTAPAAPESSSSNASTQGQAHGNAEEELPPSYEEVTAGGKLSPYYNKPN